MKLNLALLAVVVLLGTSSVSAMEMATSTDMMKKMDTATSSEMMKKDSMMDSSKKMNDSVMQKSDMMDSKMMKSQTNLAHGARGAEVEHLQTMLIEQGYLVMPSGAAKGYFGPLTKMAVKKLQESLGVAMTGYYGPMTRAGHDKKMMMKDDTNMQGGEMKKMDKAM